VGREGAGAGGVEKLHGHGEISWVSDVKTSAAVVCRRFGAA
jgi:hypothetical protein